MQQYTTKNVTKGKKVKNRYQSLITRTKIISCAVALVMAYYSGDWICSNQNTSLDIEYYSSKYGEYCYIVGSPSGIHTGHRIRFENLEKCMSFIEKI